jgi:protein ImuB
MIVCVLIPRFPLLAALGERRALVAEPVALAPESGREQFVGEASAAAEARGVTAGMRMGEALSRCPGLRLVPPDPEATRAVWHAVLDGIESIGGAPESERAGAAFFDASGLMGIHGGNLEGVLGATRGVLRNGRDGRGFAARLAAGPSRFTAYCAARQARPRKPAPVVDERGAPAFLAPLPASLLRSRPELTPLVEALERLGIRTIGELAALPSRAVAERFGHPGLLALDLARGRDTPLEPRRPAEPVCERIDLPDATSGQQLERALELLIDRVLARRERRGRTLRGVALSARLVAGGTWREAVTLRNASADPKKLTLTLKSRLSYLPAPAESFGLEVEAFGPPANDQAALMAEGAEARRDRLGEAVRQARQAAGDEAALRVLDVDPGSRLPERRSVLAPWNR